MSLRPDPHTQKILISSTAHFTGEYVTPAFRVDHAWPGLNSRRNQTHAMSQGPTARNAFVVSFKTDPAAADNLIINTYSHVGDAICAYLAVLFGKRFDSHGAIEASGFFQLPDLTVYSALCDDTLPQNTAAARPDFQIPLKLEEVRRIALLLYGNDLGNTGRAFRGASKFYLQALQSVEHDPEVAYLHLITAGEIIAGASDQDEDALLDSRIKSILRQVEEHVPGGLKAAQALRSRMRSIKRGFVGAFDTLVDPPFFDRTECSEAFGKFKRETFSGTMGAAYDLRSQYLHTGRSFGVWVRRRGLQNEEVQFGKPHLPEDRAFGKILEKAPTYIGLERVVRYSLLRMIEGVGVDLAPTAEALPQPASGESQGARSS